MPACAGSAPQQQRRGTLRGEPIGGPVGSWPVEAGLAAASQGRRACTLFCSVLYPSKTCTPCAPGPQYENLTKPGMEPLVLADLKRFLGLDPALPEARCAMLCCGIAALCCAAVMAVLPPLPCHCFFGGSRDLAPGLGPAAAYQTPAGKLQLSQEHPSPPMARVLLSLPLRAWHGAA